MHTSSAVPLEPLVHLILPTVATSQSISLFLQKQPLRYIVHQDLVLFALLISTSLEGCGLGSAKPVLESCQPQT